MSTAPRANNVLPTTSYSGTEPGADSASTRANNLSTSDASMYCSSPSINHCDCNSFGQSPAGRRPPGPSPSCPPTRLAANGIKSVQTGTREISGERDQLTAL
jgi:hypothetical protein